MGVAFSGLAKDIALYPVIGGLSSDGGCHVNLGESPFQYDPPDQTFTSVHDIMKGYDFPAWIGLAQ